MSSSLHLAWWPGEDSLNIMVITETFFSILRRNLKKKGRTLKSLFRELQPKVSAHQANIRSFNTYLCSSRALDILKLDTTSPVTRMKSERTRDLASTSRSTSPRERYRSEVTKRTVLGEVWRHHLDFLEVEQHIRKAQRSYPYREVTRTQGPSAHHIRKWMQGESCYNKPTIDRLRYAHLHAADELKRVRLWDHSLWRFRKPNSTASQVLTKEKEKLHRTQTFFLGKQYLRQGKDCTLLFSSQTCSIQRQRRCLSELFPHAAWHTETGRNATGGTLIYMATQETPDFRQEKLHANTNAVPNHSTL